MFVLMIYSMLFHAKMKMKHSKTTKNGRPTSVGSHVPTGGRFGKSTEGSETFFFCPPPTLPYRCAEKLATRSVTWNRTHKLSKP